MKKLFPLILILIAFVSKAQEHSTTNNFLNPEHQPLLIFNDTLTENKTALYSIDPETIQEIVVVHKELDEFVEKYGPDAKRGVILVYSKSYIAKKWYLEFAKHSRQVKKIVNRKDFNYLNYRLYLNTEAIEIDFFNVLDEQLQAEDILSVKYKKRSSNDILGEIYVTSQR